MKKLIYDIKEINNNKYKLVVFATSYINPINFVNEISKDLVTSNTLPGVVLFDLLACNGLSSNRFAEGYFDGKHIPYTSICSIKIIDDKIGDFCNSFYRSNIHYLKNSVLSKASLFNYLKDSNKIYSNV